MIDTIPAGVTADFSHWNDTVEFEITLTNVHGAKNGTFISALSIHILKISKGITGLIT